MGFQEKTQRRDVVEINEVANVSNRLMWRSQGPGTSSLCQCIVKSGSSTFPIPMQERGFDDYIDFLRPNGMKAGRSHISPTHSASSPCWSHRCLMRRTPLTAMTSHLEVHCFLTRMELVAALFLMCLQGLRDIQMFKVGPGRHVEILSASSRASSLCGS